MGKQSDKMMNLLTEFMVSEIGSKSLDGITYALLLKNDKDKPALNRYKEIFNEVRACGYGPDEIFRAYEISNGYIFDMDLNTVKTISAKLVKMVEKANNIEIGSQDLIGNSPEKRRKSDMNGLAKFVLDQYSKGITNCEVALFSRNSVPHIIISGKLKDKNGDKYATIKYNAYAIRHWDIEIINSELLIPRGIRIARIEPCEVLPSKTGVKFILHIESVWHN